MDHETPRGTTTIAAARLGDARAVRRLCPALYRTGSAPDRVLVARGPDGEIVAIAALAWRAFDDPPGFPLHVHVGESVRRQGVGRALVHAAAAAARTDTGRVHSWDAAAANGEAAAFACALGFTVHRRVLAFEATADSMLHAIAPFHARMRRAAPTAARTVALRDVSSADVAKLVTAAFGGRMDRAMAALQPGRVGAYDRDRSVVLVVDGVVSGALLYRWIDGVVDVDVNVVAPRFRHGWANVRLLYEATHNAAQNGARQFRFRCEDSVRDTVRLARRIGARSLDDTVHLTARIDDLLQAQTR